MDYECNAKLKGFQEEKLPDCYGCTKWSGARNNGGQMKPIRRLEKAVNALVLELPASVWKDAHGEILAAFNAAVCDEREACARIAEAPFTGQPHTEYSKGKMDAANTIAKNIRARNPEGV